LSHQNEDYQNQLNSLQENLKELENMLRNKKSEIARLNEEIKDSEKTGNQKNSEKNNILQKNQRRGE